MTGAALLLGFFRWIDCPDCGGYLRIRGKNPEEALQGRLTRRLDLGCPRCEDCGRISWFNLQFRRGVEPRIARLARSAIWPHDDRNGAEEVLGDLGERNGSNRHEYLDWVGRVGPHEHYLDWQGRFAYSEGKVYFIVALTPMSYSNLDADAPVRLLLLSLGGEVLDRLDGSCLHDGGSFTFQPHILSSIADDGTWVQIGFRQHFGANRERIPFRILHGGRTLEFPDGEELPGAWGPGGGCRVGIQSDRFIVLPSPKAASR